MAKKLKPAKEEQIQTASPRMPKEKGNFRRCIVEASVLSIKYGYSRALGVGAIIDIDEPVAPGLKLRDLVQEQWFKPIEPGGE